MSFHIFCNFFTFWTKISFKNFITLSFVNYNWNQKNVWFWIVLSKTVFKTQFSFNIFNGIKFWSFLRNTKSFFNRFFDVVVNSEIPFIFQCIIYRNHRNKISQVFFLVIIKNKIRSFMPFDVVFFDVTITINPFVLLMKIGRHSWDFFCVEEIFTMITYQLCACFKWMFTCFSLTKKGWFVKFFFISTTKLRGPSLLILFNLNLAF